MNLDKDINVINYGMAVNHQEFKLRPQQLSDKQLSVYHVTCVDEVGFR